MNEYVVIRSPKGDALVAEMDRTNFRASLSNPLTSNLLLRFAVNECRVTVKQIAQLVGDITEDEVAQLALQYSAETSTDIRTAIFFGAIKPLLKGMTELEFKRRCFRERLRQAHLRKNAEGQKFYDELHTEKGFRSQLTYVLNELKLSPDRIAEFLSTPQLGGRMRVSGDMIQKWASGETSFHFVDSRRYEVFAIAVQRVISELPG